MGARKKNRIKRESLNVTGGTVNRLRVSRPARFSYSSMFADRDCIGISPIVSTRVLSKACKSSDKIGLRRFAGIEVIHLSSEQSHISSVANLDAVTEL